MRIQMKFCVAVAVLVALPACTYVELTPRGKDVMLISAEKAESCKKIGQTVVALHPNVAGGFTKPEEVVIDLERTARNTAPRLNGNAVAAISEISDGQQTFAIYNCS